MRKTAEADFYDGSGQIKLPDYSFLYIITYFEEKIYRIRRNFTFVLRGFEKSLCKSVTNRQLSADLIDLFTNMWYNTTVKLWRILSSNHFMRGNRSHENQKAVIP